MLASLGEEIEKLRNDIEEKADRSVLGEAAKHLEEKLQKLDEGMEELSRKQEMTNVDLKDIKREVRSKARNTTLGLTLEFRINEGDLDNFFSKI